VSGLSDALDFLIQIFEFAPTWISFGVSVFLLVGLLRLVLPFVG